MSFTLKSIELNNIRAHEYFKFEPASSGITAISGDNGAGKSTIVDAFAWNLYGTRPSGVRNKDLIKDGVNPREKPVSVKSIIVSGGIEYAIERKVITRQGSVECNVWGKKPGADKFTQVAGPAVTHVEKFIRGELGMNEKGFLTSVLIQQKQVDQIVSATPRERGAVIEELTGIASITEAITKTNENTRSLEKAARMFHVGDVDKAKERVLEQEELCKETDIKESEANKELSNIKKEYSKMSSNIKEEKQKLDKSNSLKMNIEGMSKQITFLENQSKDDLDFIENYLDKYTKEVKESSSKIKTLLDKKQSKSYEIRSSGSVIKKDLENISKELIQCIESTKMFDTKKDANEHLENLDSKIINLSKKLNEKKDERAMLTSEIKHSKASHDHISGEEENCPVCNSELEDPEKLKKEIEDLMKSYESKKKEVSKEIKEIDGELKKTKTSKDNTISAIKLIERKETLTEEKALAEDKLNKLSEENEIVKEELLSLNKKYETALKAEEANKRYLEAKRRSSTVNESIKENEQEIALAMKNIEKVNSLSDKEYNAMLSDVESKRDELSKLTIESKEISGRKILELERLEDYKSNLKDVEESIERYNDLAEQIQISSSAAAMLSTFKADRIEHAIPTLEFFASDFLSKFTGGAFTKLSVDEKFNTSVTTSDNIERPVAQLSGGELSSAAIALRLGIAMLLNSSEKNVLILDEVLVSMDEDRSRQIMETIGSMTNSQVIFIAHNNDINSVADKTVLVTKE